MWKDHGYLHATNDKDHPCQTYGFMRPMKLTSSFSCLLMFIELNTVAVHLNLSRCALMRCLVTKAVAQTHTNDR